MKRTSLACLAIAFSLSAAAQATEPDLPPVVEQATQALCDKRVALLGELPSHGEARAFQLKAAIARELVQRCGFRTLVFEAPVYEFLGRTFGSQRQLDDAIGRFWWAKELAPWRGWLFEEAKHGRLQLRGMDDQVSDTAAHAKASLPALVAANLPGDAASACRASVQRQLEWSYDETHHFDEAEQQRLVDCTHRAAASRKASWSGDRESINAVSLRSLASYMARQVGRKDVRDRDSVMYSNATLDGGEKIIVWTATVHAAKQQGGLAWKPVGAWMAERWGAEVGAIGFTALGGTSSRAGGPPKALVAAPAASLEARVLAPGAEESFADASHLRELGAIESRLFGKFQSADWSQSFDGVVVVREEQAPGYAAPY